MHIYGMQFENRNSLVRFFTFGTDKIPPPQLLSFPRYQGILVADCVLSTVVTAKICKITFIGYKDYFSLKLNCKLHFQESYFAR